jgi:serine/threonine-protein kinase HipA
MGNTDAHTKNWALRYADGRHPSLAPAYDMVCVSAYFDANNPLALAQNRQMDASLRHWGEDEAQALAQKAGILRFNQMRRVVRETRLKARALWPALLQEHPGKAATEIARRLQTMP